MGLFGEVNIESFQNMAKVYFKALTSHASPEEISAAAQAVLTALVEQEAPELEKHIPLKVHFGEKGNRTYLKPECYNGIIDFLESRGVSSAFAETSVLYGGERFTREKHERLAAAHGFTRLPVMIADGDKGEDASDVETGLKHFKSCAVARKLAESGQVLVAAHFKGHALAGFGGAIKQLSMGFAAKGGKLAMHMNVKPVVRKWLCKGCGLCIRRCQVEAVTLNGKKAVIDHNKCIGCGACFSICPHHGISVWSLSGLCNALFHRELFREKLVEYAYAAAHGKKHIYINFAVNVTAGCDCEPRPMRQVVPNIGIFASMDPVAVDSACYEAVAKAGKRFKGEVQLDYASKIGLGTRQVELITL